VQDEDRPSPEQDDIVASALQPLAITACAGSGKTRTAVRRLAAVRERAAGNRGQVLLLSFSNVAVDTFTRAYSEFARKTGREPSRDRVRIQTIDGCLTNDILRPHAYRTMNCPRVPFLVTGAEGFLQSNGFKFYMDKTDGSGRYPLAAHEISNLFVRSLGATTSVCLRRKRGPAVEVPSSMTVLARWAAVGAYTHSFGQYWAYQTLVQQQWLAAAMARRYPHILVDEAQDIGHWHQALLELLIANGSQVSLIGDPHQAIFEFAGADGKFLKDYGGKPGVLPKKLSMNFRSVKAVQDVANLLSNRLDGSDRTIVSRDAGAFFFPYHDKDLPLLERAFLAHLLDNKLEPSRSAVICRGQALKKRLRAYETEQGEGLVKRLAKAALLRDEGGHYHDAYKLVVASVCDMLEASPNDLAHKLSTPWTAPGELRAMSHSLWSFTRDPMLGLPSSLLAAKSEWHPQLLVALEKLVERIEEVTPYRVDSKYRARIRTNKLPDNALLLRAAEDTAATTILRASTVHGVKGESLDAVLYITEKSHATEMADGTLTEVGRIGYVALTRARDIFWMAVPATAMAELRPKLLAKGLVELAVPGVGEQVINTKRTGIKVKDSTQVPTASPLRTDPDTSSPDPSETVG
jgi:superfamily I DNA/RNA helicase